MFLLLLNSKCVTYNTYSGYLERIQDLFKEDGTECDDWGLVVYSYSHNHNHNIMTYFDSMDGMKFIKCMRIVTILITWCIELAIALMLFLNFIPFCFTHQIETNSCFAPKTLKNFPNPICSHTYVQTTEQLFYFFCGLNYALRTKFRLLSK